MDDRIIEAVCNATGCNYDEAEQFLESERGCYADIGGRNIWMSGQLIRQILEAALD